MAIETLSFELQFRDQTPILTQLERAMILATLTGATDDELATRFGQPRLQIKRSLAELFQRLGVRGRQDLLAKLLREALNCDPSEYALLNRLKIQI